MIPRVLPAMILGAEPGPNPGHHRCRKEETGRNWGGGEGKKGKGKGKLIMSFKIT